MNIGLVYDLKDDYKVENDFYCDFSTNVEVEHVKKSLLDAGFNVVDIGSPFRLKEHILNENINIDLIFNMAEGYKSRNREGLVPAICEFFNIKYIGTDAFGMSFSLHKMQTKLFLNNLGVSTAKCFLFMPSIHDLSNLDEDLSNNGLSFPIIVKPNHEGSSMGVTLVHNISQAKSTIEKLVSIFKQDILCEEYLYGKEMSVPLYQEKQCIKILGIAEFADTSNEHIGVFTTEKKNNGYHIQKQPEISRILQEKIETKSILVFKALKFSGYARIDWIIRDDEPFFLEATPLPCFEPNNCFEWSLKEHKITFSQFLKKVIELQIKEDIKK